MTTKQFLSQYGLESFRELPDMEMVEDAGLLNKDALLAGNFLAEVDAPADENSDGDEAEVA